MKTILILFLLTSFGNEYRNEWRGGYVRHTPQPIKYKECKRHCVPEPASIVILGLGSLTFLYRRRK